MLIRNLNLRHLEDDDLAGGGGGDETETFETDNPGGDNTDGGDAASGGIPDDGLDDLFGADDGADDGSDGGTGAGQVTKNPSVTAVLDNIREALPKGLHGFIIDERLAPELTKMQQGWDAEMAKVQPYRDLEKHGVTAEEAVAALGIAEFIRDNPDEALRQIATVVQGRGLNPAEILGIKAAVAAAADQGAGGGDGGDELDPDIAALLGQNPDLAENPVLQQILAKVGGLEQGLKQQTEAQRKAQEQARQAQEQQEIAAAMAKLKSGFDARGVHLNENAVLQYAVGYVNGLPEAQRNNIDPFQALKAGAAAWMKDVQAAGQQLQRRAPRLGGGRGGIGAAGAPAPQEAPKSIEDRKAKFLADVAAGKLGGGAES